MSEYLKDNGLPVTRSYAAGLCAIYIKMSELKALLHSHGSLVVDLPELAEFDETLYNLHEKVEMTMISKIYSVE